MSLLYRIKINQYQIMSRYKKTVRTRTIKTNSKDKKDKDKLKPNNI